MTELSISHGNQQLLKNLRIVLVEPQGPLNVGSVCRAMKNFGLRKLSIVRPGCELGMEAIKMALHAKDILDNAKIVQTIPEAVTDCHLVLGTSNRCGPYHEPNMTVQEGIKRMASIIPDHKIAILFGREEWGLTKDDLQFCQGTIRIVTDPAFTSMNLSQAVLLIAYELYQAFGIKPKASPKNEGNSYMRPASVEDINRLFDHMKRVMSNCEFLPRTNPDGLFQVIRAFIHKSSAQKRETNILMGFFSNLDGFMRKYVKQHPDWKKPKESEDPDKPLDPNLV